MRFNRNWNKKRRKCEWLLFGLLITMLLSALLFGIVTVWRAATAATQRRSQTLETRPKRRTSTKLVFLFTPSPNKNVNLLVDTLREHSGLE